MQVKTKIGGATVTGAEGVVWDEQFTFDACEYIARLLDLALQGNFYGVAEPHAAAVERVRDMFQALTNDSDACVVHCEMTAE